ncbi:hypothetical protein Saso_71350 [Streptomyces asoensis]|uniref:Uncharacterized protein n=1 Tax=Streptomyces asoensis TaxID=249586 RepID=A0ABQ3SBI9_9ACTN|nr:hypothetical protein GCM10010496_20260 [Streptomyces asoensis]GHI65485.1 hypothetical protein Saso_71350 [Streptomyces asoensis]
MNVGSTFAYEPTHSIATKGASRHRAMATRTGVTTGPLVTSGLSDIGGSAPHSIALITGVMRRQCK